MLLCLGGGVCRSTLLAWSAKCCTLSSLCGCSRLSVVGWTPSISNAIAASLVSSTRMFLASETKMPCKGLAHKLCRKYFPIDKPNSTGGYATKVRTPLLNGLSAMRKACPFNGRGVGNEDVPDSVGRQKCISCCSQSTSFL